MTLFGLFLQGQSVLTVDHRVALSNPALVSAPAKVPERQLSNLRVELFHVYWLGHIRFAFADNLGSPFEELVPPSLDDIRVDIKLRRQFGQCLFAPTAASATFDL